MTQDIKDVLKMALEALERSVATCFDQYAHQQVMSHPDHFINTAITAIKEALAETQEPVATVESVATVVSESGNQEVTMSWWHEPALPVGTKLYTTPPQRTWVGLTDEEEMKLAQDSMGKSRHWLVAQVEAKLKRKNGFAEEKNT